MSEASITSVAAPAAGSEHVDAYLRVRTLEGRILDDDAVRRLPAVGAGDPLADEWRLRAASAERLLAYLRALPQPPVVLDAGAGNCWLAGRIAELPGTRVVALDVNEPELRQGARVFGARANMSFALGDAASAAPTEQVDVVVLASSIQYFADVDVLLGALRGWLHDDGELHVLDSPLYAAGELAAARARTRAYYAALGVPEMADGYHAHGHAALAAYRPVMLARPRRRPLPGRGRSPFPWLRIAAAAIPASTRRARS